MDSKLSWKDYIKKEQTQIKLKIKDINWLIGRKFKVPLEKRLYSISQLYYPFGRMGSNYEDVPAKQM